MFANLVKIVILPDSRACASEKAWESAFVWSEGNDRKVEILYWTGGENDFPNQKRLIDERVVFVKLSIYKQKTRDAERIFPPKLFSPAVQDNILTSRFFSALKTKADSQAFSN